MCFRVPGSLPKVYCTALLFLPICILCMNNKSHTINLNPNTTLQTRIIFLTTSLIIARLSCQMGLYLAYDLLVTGMEVFTHLTQWTKQHLTLPLSLFLFSQGVGNPSNNNNSIDKRLALEDYRNYTIVKTLV